ncbi:LacI family DNA-binding transcriptional regulator [Novosphingobium ovatum]|uniref:LacI family DNA-binding transcriptional regulator n=1 Tax=Novosphingobium ovatum TaxID=1908523 RepID=UPI0029FF071C|nr:LacI family DNA-binding transcriptional regulator [Novosphingobium ovatum]
MPHRVTIQDVAARAGVSAMTVSNVINRKGKTSQATRDNVQRIIREMGYVPSQAARSLVGAAAARIGLMYYDADSPFIDTLIAAVALATAESGLQLLMRDVRGIDPASVVAAAQGLARSGADGLLLMPPFAEMMAEHPGFAALNVPAVAIATARGLPGMASVRIDNGAAMRDLACGLIARGRRRIACVTGPRRHSDSQARLDGFLQAMAQAGLDVPDAYVVEGGFTFATGLAAAQALLTLPERPDAIMAASDDMAAAVLLAAHRAGLDVPGDLTVTGFDDTSIAMRVWPALTTVRQPLRAMAGAAVGLLAQGVRAGTGALAGDTVLDFDVIWRESTPA